MTCKYCKKIAKARKMCTRHYAIWYRNMGRSEILRNGSRSNLKRNPMVTCIADGCNNKTNRRKKLCNSHISRFYRYGDYNHYPDNSLTPDQLEKINNFNPPITSFKVDPGEYTPFKRDDKI